MVDGVGARIRRLVGIPRPDTHYAIYVDGPNMLRESIDIDFRDVHDAVTERGEVRRSEVFLDHRASPGLIQAAEAAGFAVHTTSGDVDVALAVEATAAIDRLGLQGLALATRDIDFKPVLEHARARGVRTLVIVPDTDGRSTGLETVADEIVVI